MNIKTADPDGIDNLIPDDRSLIVPILFQRTIRKPLITSGAGFNVYHYGMNSGNGPSGNV
jgi:hypothetical protein